MKALKAALAALSLALLLSLIPFSVLADPVVEDEASSSGAHGGGETSRVPSGSSAVTSGEESSGGAGESSGAGSGEEVSSKGPSSVSSRRPASSRPSGGAGGGNAEPSGTHSYVEVDSDTLSQPSDEDYSYVEPSSSKPAGRGTRLGSKIARVIWIPALFAVGSAAALVVVNVRYRRENKRLRGGKRPPRGGNGGSGGSGGSNGSGSSGSSGKSGGSGGGSSSGKSSVPPNIYIPRG